MNSEMLYKQYDPRTVASWSDEKLKSEQEKTVRQVRAKVAEMHSQEMCDPMYDPRSAAANKTYGDRTSGKMI